MDPVDTAARYHIVPQQHQSIDETEARNDERLIGSDDNTPSPPFGSNNFTLTFSPTIYTRALACIFAIACISICFQSGINQLIGLAILCIFCLVRQVLVIFGHLLCKIVASKPLEFRVVINDKDVPLHWWNGLFKWILFLADLIIILGLLICLPVSSASLASRWWPSRSVTAIHLGYVTLAFNLLSAIDRGQPNSVTVVTGYRRITMRVARIFWNVDFKGMNAEEPETARISPQIYSDIEAPVTGTRQGASEGNIVL